MKLINKEFIKEQEALNDVVTNLRAELIPLMQFGKEKSEKLIKLREQYAIAVSDLLKSKIASDCIVKCEFDDYDNGLKVIVIRKDDENDFYNPSFDIDFVAHADDGEKIGNVSNINNIQVRFNSDEPHNRTATYNMLIILGALAQWIKNNASGLVIIQNYFLELTALKNEVEDADKKIKELNQKIKIEQLSIVKFEIDMFFYEGNAMLEVEKFNKVKSYGSDYPMYSLHNANLHEITNTARITANIKNREANFEYDSKTSKYKNLPYNFLNIHSDKKYNVEEFIEKLAKNAVNKNYILFLLKKPEAQKLIETTGGDNKKFKDKEFVAEIGKLLEEETKICKALEKENQEEED